MIKLIFTFIVFMASFYNLYSIQSNTIRETIKHNTMKLEPTFDLKSHSKKIIVKYSYDKRSHKTSTLPVLFNSKKQTMYTSGGTILNQHLTYSSQRNPTTNNQNTEIKFINTSLNDFHSKIYYQNNTNKMYTLDDHIGTDPTNPIPTPLDEEYLWLLLLVLTFTVYKFLLFKNKNSLKKMTYEKKITYTQQSFYNEHIG